MKQHIVGGPRGRYRQALLSVGLLVAMGSVAQEQVADIPAPVMDTANELAEVALASELAWSIASSLTTEVGPRLAGSDGEARARKWAVAMFDELGFSNPRVETFPLAYWTRGERAADSVVITKPFPQPLFATSLGGGGKTSALGLEAEIVFFPTFDDLLALRDADLSGKIVYVNDQMTKAQTGEGYGFANRKRRLAWREAERLGASAVLIRSVGTSSHRFPHTGMMGGFDLSLPKIPALALSAPDADQIQRIVEQGETVTVRVETDAGWRGEVESGNVIAEIKGRENPDEYVLLGAHLDSWDLGTGALDDGAGVAIVTAAAKLIADLPTPPKRSIRVVLYGAEEVGLKGAFAYADKHKNSLKKIAVAAESDFGAGRIWRFDTNWPEAYMPMKGAIMRVLGPLGVAPGNNEARGGPDLFPLRPFGVPVVTLQQDGTDYFDYHHTPDDTLDKIDKAALAQNVAVYAAFAYFMAELDYDFWQTTEDN